MPEILVSDNGPQFCSKEFEEFCTQNGILHRTSAVCKPATNGQAERVVQILKSALRQARLSKQDDDVVISRYLLVYRNTPHSTTGVSPAMLLMGRRLRTRLDLMLPSFQKRVNSSQDKMVKQSKSHGLCELELGDNVLVRNFGKGDKWMKGVIIEVLGSRHC